MADVPGVFLSDSGKGAEIRAYLEEALCLPPNLRWFDVRFESGRPVTVRCEFMPMPFEGEDPDAPTPAGARSLDD